MKKSLTDEVKDYLLEVDEATATQIAEATGRQRANISKILRSGEDFVPSRKSGRDQYYGVKTSHNV